MLIELFKHIELIEPLPKADIELLSQGFLNNSLNGALKILGVKNAPPLLVSSSLNIPD
jgi:hypothetical protein